MTARLVTGRYRLEHELGRGGMGTVWLGEDQLAGRQVAVKELRPPRGLSDEEQENFTRRALQEARNVARIQHANAVTLFDVIPATSDDEAVYLIMEYVHGRTLAEVIAEDGAVSDESAKAIGLQVLSILETAHSLGVVHRDIKPANIMMTPGGEAKLADFGIAYSMGDTRLTRSGVYGTQAYMAPELFHSAPITPAVDLWSLGATLYYAVEGRGPFDRENTAATLRAILDEELPTPTCSPDLAAAISGLLARDPDQRFTVSQARAALMGEAVVSSQTTAHAASPGSATRTSSVPSPPPSRPQAPVPDDPAMPTAPAPPQLSATGDSELTSTFGPSYTAVQREHPPMPPVVEDQIPGPPAKATLGTRRIVAASVIGLGTLLVLIGLFLPIYGKTPLYSASRWLWPSLLYVLGWIAVTAWLLIPRLRPRSAALFSLGLGVTAIGLALQELAEITSVWPIPGVGFTLALVGEIIGIAGAAYALAVPDSPTVAGHSALPAAEAAAWRRLLPPVVGLVATTWSAAFPWMQGTPSAFGLIGRSAWEGLGVVVPILMFLAVAGASVRIRLPLDRTGLLVGAMVYLLAIVLQDVVTVATLQFGKNLTLFFWLYCVLVVAVICLCTRKLGSGVA